MRVMIRVVNVAVSLDQHIIHRLIGSAATAETLNTILMREGVFHNVEIMDVVVSYDVSGTHGPYSVFGVRNIIVFYQSVISPQFDRGDPVAIRSYVR